MLRIFVGKCLRSNCFRVCTSLNGVKSCQSNHQLITNQSYVSLFSSSAAQNFCPKYFEQRQPIGQVHPKMQLSFTCKICCSKVTKHISKQAYNKGIVIVVCDGCDNKHLIADNLGWFTNASNGMRNIEEIMASKGETVKTELTNGCYEIKLEE